MKKRLPFVILSWLLILGNLAGLAKLFMSKDSFSRTYQRIPSAWLDWIFVLPILSILALAALLENVKGAWQTILFLSLVVLAMDLYAAVWEHAAAVVLSTVLLLFFFFRQRKA